MTPLQVYLHVNLLHYNEFETFLSKTTRNSTQKREIHQFKKDNPKAKNDEIFSWIVSTF